MPLPYRLTPVFTNITIQADTLLYVGKAKNLRKRISSYFTKTFTSYKTHELVQRIKRIEFTIVPSEQDAFLLENSLIKQFQPRFNINLKDDKTYPYIVIKKEHFPRVFLTRSRINDGSEYLGLFTSVARGRELLDFVKTNIQLRTCKLNLSLGQYMPKASSKYASNTTWATVRHLRKAFKPEEDYGEGLQQLRNILERQPEPRNSTFQKEMRSAAEELAFEKAQILHKKIEHLEQYQARSVIVSRHLGNADVFSILRDGDVAYVTYLMMQNGTIVQTHTSQWETHLDDPVEEILAFAVAQLRTTFNSLSAENHSSV